MAATIARAQGYNKKGEQQNLEATRLGHGSVQASVNTWRTFVTAFIKADGQGDVEVRRDGKLIHVFTFAAEEENAR